MEYEKFKEQFVEDLKERLEAGGEKFSVDLNAVQKMNQNYEAVTVKPEDAIIGVNLNMTEIYERYDRGMSYDTLVSEVAEKADRALHDHPDFNLDAIQDYDQMKEKLSMEVVSAERNADLLEKVPHKNMEDMAVVYRFVLDSDSDGRGSILVTNQLMDNYGITAEQLHADALQYAPVMRPAVIQTMAETLLEMMGPEAKDMIPVLPDDPLFVATVPDKIQGAGVLAYQDFMEQAAERVGGDFFILPSSIHEILLVRDDGTFDINHLEGMVKQVNETEVAPEDLLTDSVYHYDSKEKVFELAEKYEERTASRKRESTLDKLQEKSREHIAKDIGSRPIARGGEAL
ncbi:DUF5688 family protein [Butyrivibrio sp. INlla14]|uniref:DUF5688 family protein n=1 Tax=Butyrivibrio sp. INlla14 TaxID=1520808 RepID=UPI0008768907|nr:DUF5688 family protein [Butyrivibrio sp. INlla14]SCY62699.1 hypothetical protein SAMN02910371_03083 [Butyrivibrio sp. INlla14]